MIKAYQIHGTDESVKSIVRLKAMTVPKAEPGVGELRICAQFIGLNRADLMYVRGQSMHPTTVGTTPGYEVVGKVDAVGIGVSAFKVGDLVSTVPGFSPLNYGVSSE
jgi:NADPH:quinone reductase